MMTDKELQENFQKWLVENNLDMLPPYPKKVLFERFVFDHKEAEREEQILESRVSIRKQNMKRLEVDAPSILNRRIKTKLFPNGKAPEYKTAEAACADCYARVEEDVVIKPNDRVLIPLGFALELHRGLEAVIRPRSGLSKKKIDITIGTCDSDYRGEYMACVVNNSDEDFVVHKWDRICQLKVQNARQYKFQLVEELSGTERGAGGFGSTGIK